MSVFGSVLTLPAVERAVMAHVRLWLPDYLAHVERQEAVRPDGTPLHAGDLPRPRSWRPTGGPIDKWPEDQLPAVVFGSPGVGGDGTHREGGGAYSSGWAIGISTVASGRDDETTRWLCGLYVAALRLLFMQQASVAGLEVRGARWEDEAYDDLPFRRSGSLMAGTTTFTLELGGFGESALGPAAPSADPLPDPGTFPEVQTADLILERSPVA